MNWELTNNHESEYLIQRWLQSFSVFLDKDLDKEYKESYVINVILINLIEI